VLIGTVIVVGPTRIYRKPGLGNCSKALCARHGLAIGGHIWSFRGGRRGPFRLRPYSECTLIRKYAIADIGEPFTSCADPTSSTRNAPFSLQTEFCGGVPCTRFKCHQSFFQAIPSNWMGSRRSRCLCNLRSGARSGSISTNCEK
jgi:hypothetical protein